MVTDSVEQLLKCAGCGAPAEPVNASVEPRVPCQSCGSKSRLAAVGITACIQPSGHFSALQERDAQAIGFSESERQGRSTTGFLRDDGSLDISLVGSSPQGEDDTSAVCHVLKDRLNRDGAHWGNVETGYEPADCILVDAHDPHTTLQVQVVRAIVSQDLWRELNSGGSAQRSLPPAAAANEIRKSIAFKARETKIPERMRSTLALVLDATRLPGLAF